MEKNWYRKAQEKFYEMFEQPDKTGKLGRIFRDFFTFLILLNVVAVVLETVDFIYRSYWNFFRWFAMISIVIFTIEYLLRLWCCTVDERYKHPIWGRLKFALTIPMLIDLMAIVPFYFSKPGTLELSSFRAARLFRFFRLIKGQKYQKAVNVLKKAFILRKEQLTMSLSLYMLLLFSSASIVYFFERVVQPQVFRNIPITLYWCLTTMTTLGYGDIVPLTSVGRATAMVLSFMGIGLFAIPTGILSSAFMEVMADRKEMERNGERIATCPKCGHKFVEMIKSGKEPGKEMMGEDENEE